MERSPFVNNDERASDFCMYDQKQREDCTALILFLLFLQELKKLAFFFVVSFNCCIFADKVGKSRFCSRIRPNNFKMNQTSQIIRKRQLMYVLLVVAAVVLVCAGVSFWAFSYVMSAETHVRYVGLQNLISEKMTKTVSGTEVNAKNVFDEVEKHLDSPESVIAALKSKTSLAPDVRGYFAAFEPDYFKEKGRWFEPYVHHSDNSEFVLTMVGSARHDYTKSDWYVRAKKSKGSFWSEPYYYYDGTDISGHYCTFVEPLFDANGQLACVCGADITFDWLTKKLQQIDSLYRHHEPLNKYRLMRDLDFYSVVVDYEGTCLIHPDDKKLPIKDKDMLQDMLQKKSGTKEMTVDGVASTLYYGPIEGINWTLVVVTPKHDVLKPTLVVGMVLLTIAVLGIVAVWIICRRLRNEEEI